MTRGDLNVHNEWCAFAASDGFAGLVATVRARLSKTLGAPVELKAVVVDVVGREPIERLCAAGRFAFVIECGKAGRAVAVASRLLPARVLKLLSGSDKLSVSHSFCRAAIELWLLDAAAAVSEATGADLLVSPMPSGAVLGGETFVQIRVAMRVNEPAGDLALFIPACLPPPVDRFSARPHAHGIRASAGFDLEPVQIELLEGLMPGDVLNLSAAGAAPTTAMALDMGRGTSLDYRIDREKLLGEGTVRIEGGPMETNTAEAKVIPAGDTGAATGPETARHFRLPVRLEILAFEIPSGDLDKLAPGGVLETRAEPGRTVKMYVCGELFAEGRLEHLEGFDGFRIEKVF
jgi:hypothetical protein